MRSREKNCNILHIVELNKGRYCVFYIKSIAIEQVTCTKINVNITILQATVQRMWSNESDNPFNPP